MTETDREIAKTGETKVKNDIWYTSEADKNIKFRGRKLKTLFSVIIFTKLFILSPPSLPPSPPSSPHSPHSPSPPPPLPTPLLPHFLYPIPLPCPPPPHSTHPTLRTLWWFKLTIIWINYDYSSDIWTVSAYSGLVWRSRQGRLGNDSQQWNR